MASIDEMSTEQKLQLIANLLVSIKQGVQEEYAGTDVVPAVSEAVDEMAGILGEAQKAIGDKTQADANPTEVEPGTPKMPDEGGGEKPTAA